MRKTILKITLGGVLAVTAAMGVQMASSNKTVSNLFMQNVEALASGENNGDSDNCSMYELSKTATIIVIGNAKNKVGGALAGCEKKCDHTCTIKNSDIKP